MFLVRSSTKSAGAALLRARAATSTTTTSYSTMMTTIVPRSVVVKPSSSFFSSSSSRGFSILSSGRRLAGAAVVSFNNNKGVGSSVIAPNSTSFGGATTAVACFSSSSSSSVVGSNAALKESYDNILVEYQPRKEASDGGDSGDDDTTDTGGYAVITLNRPKALNALNDALFDDLIHACTILDIDENIGCIVLTGSSKAFAAGADISEMCHKQFEDVYSTDMFSEWQVISKLKKTPIIAAVSGYCLGGGCELAMMCDIIVASSNAKFGQPEINLGVIAGAGGTQRLTRMIGKSKSMYMNLTGDFLSAHDAYTSNLIAKLYDTPEELLIESKKMASKIASKGKLSVQACLEAVNAANELPLQEGLRLERRLFHSLFATSDQKEGMNAFLTKRTPKFK